MEKIKAQLQAIKLMLTESVMTDQNLGSTEARTIFSQLKEIESDLDRVAEKKSHKRPFLLPTMPKDVNLNAYPRLLLAVIKEYSDRDESFTMEDIETKAGSSRSQISRDLKKLEKSGYAHLEKMSYRGKQKVYKYFVM